MSDNYFRKFIVLDSYDSFTNKIKGYAKIEIRQGKGKLQINIDGLKDFDKDNNLLKAYVVSEDTKFEKIYIGTIDIATNGKGSLEHQFNSLSINNSGIPFDKVNIILIKSFGDDLNNVNLGGYIYKNNDSIVSLVSNIENEVKGESVEIKNEEVQKEELIKEEPKMEVDEEPEINEEETEAFEVEEVDTLNYEDVEEVEVEELEYQNEEIQENNIEEQSEVKDDLESIYAEVKNEFKDIEDIIEDDFVEDIDYKEYDFEDYEFEELEEIEEYDDIDEEVNEYEDNNEEVNEYEDIDNQKNINELIEEDYKRYKDIQANYNEYINNYYANSLNHNYNRPENSNLEEYTMKILKMFDKSNNLKRGLKNYEWWYVDKNNKYKEHLPYYPCTVNMYYPHPIMYKEMTCQKLIYKYGHFIFGLVKKNEKIKYFVFGVPGRFKRIEQPYSGKTGFSSWIEKKTKGRYRMGYWLIHIDPTSGKVVNPLKPTPPR